MNTFNFMPLKGDNLEQKLAEVAEQLNLTEDQMPIYIWGVCPSCGVSMALPRMSWESRANVINVRCCDTCDPMGNIPAYIVTADGVHHPDNC